MLLRTVDSKAKTLSMAKHVHQMQTKWSERAERDHDQTYVGKKKTKNENPVECAETTLIQSPYIGT